MRAPDDIQPAELGIRRLLWIFATLSVLLLVALAIVPARSWFTEWRSAQQHYNRLAVKGGVAPVEISIKQIWKPALEITDRCASCHVATDGTAAIAGDPLFAAHPPIPHDPREFGCTVCHGGQGRATTADAAHGNVAHWNEPLLPRGDEEAGCGSCHTHIKIPPAAAVAKGKQVVIETKCLACHSIENKGQHIGPDLSGIGLEGFRSDWHAHHVERAGAAKDGPWTSFVTLADEEVTAVEAYLGTLVGAPLLMQAKTLAFQSGCRGCHKISSVGGDDGPDLSDEGRKLAVDLDFSHVEPIGEHTLPRWLKAHFLDPQKVSPGSGMPNLHFTDGEASLLTLYTLSLRGRSIPEGLTPKDRVRGVKLGERDFATDGPSLFGVFCVACHGARGEGRKFPGLPANVPSVLPAIGDAEFLALADDDFLRKTITHGRPGRRMPAWGTNDGGLRPEEIDAVVHYLRSLEPHPPTFEAVMASPVDAAKGTELFARHCSPCHGKIGEGSAVAPPLAAADSPVSHDDNRIYGTVSVGVGGTAMGAFHQFDAAAMRDVIAAVRALPPIAGLSRAGWSARPGDAKRGRLGYTANCARCHGENGEGKDAPALANPSLLATAGDGYLTATIIRGRGQTAMPHFGETAKDHPALGPDQVADIVAYLRSLAPHPKAP